MLNTKDTPYPFRQDGETTYRIGRFVTTLATPELRMAYERNEVEAIGQIAFYDKADIFSVFVNRMWYLRQQYLRDGNEYWAKLCKLLMNSLFGKFGQKGGGWQSMPDEKWEKDYGTEIIWDHKDQRFYNWRCFAGHVQKQVEPGEIPRSFPAIAAHVTSYGRVKLQKTLEMIPRKCVYYWDTDSVHVNETGFKMLQDAGMIRANEMGYLSLKAEFDHVEYVNSKVYFHDGHATIAGKPRDKAMCGPYEFEYEVWDDISRILQHEPHGSTLSRVRHVSLDGLYCRRRVSPDGWTSPIFEDTYTQLEGGSDKS